MHRTAPRVGLRLGLAAASLLLSSLAACSDDAPQASAPATSAAPTASPSASMSGPSTAAPGPSGSATTSAPPAPATTPVPPPTPGDVNSTVPSKPEESKPPVKLDKPATTGTGITARLGSITAIKAKAEQPGEVAGPALAITVELANTGSKPVDLSTLVVNLAGSDDAPGNQMSAAPSHPLSGAVAAGKTRSGVYVFTVPKGKRHPVTVTVDLAGAPVLAFTGNAS